MATLCLCVSRCSSGHAICCCACNNLWGNGVMAKLSRLLWSAVCIIALFSASCTASPRNGTEKSISGSTLSPGQSDQQPAGAPASAVPPMTAVVCPDTSSSILDHFYSGLPLLWRTKSTGWPGRGQVGRRYTYGPSRKTPIPGTPSWCHRYRFQPFPEIFCRQRFPRSQRPKLRTPLRVRRRRRSTRKIEQPGSERWGG